MARPAETVPAAPGGRRPGLGPPASPAGLLHNNLRRTAIVTESSHDTRFHVHDCLPRDVRRLPASDLRYALLHLVVERMLDHVKSACRHSLQKKLLFVDRVLFAAPPLVVAPTDLGEALAALRLVTAEQWVQRLLCTQPPSDTAAAPPCTPAATTSATSCSAPTCTSSACCTTTSSTGWTRPRCP